MGKEQTLRGHYEQLLGLDERWEVEEVKVEIEDKRVVISLKHVGKGGVICPECSGVCTIADHGKEREWRHLDTMQFETVLRTRVPRADCKVCGVKTIEVPWAGKHSAFTWLFESFAIAVLQSASSISKGSALLGIGWDGAQRIMSRAVERGLAKRELEGIRQVGIDEKSFKRGQSYISVLNEVSLEKARVIEVVEGRTDQAASELLKNIPQPQQASIEGVGMDMWEAFSKATRQVLPKADIVHDKYHVSAYLNKAVDQVRRAEHKQLMVKGDQTLKGSKYKWLRTYKDKRCSAAVSFRQLHQQGLKTSKAWHFKEDFRHFWSYVSTSAAQRFYRDWRKAVMRSRLEPLKKVVRMMDQHWPEILNFIKHRFTNAASEGLNSLIQAIKNSARGFRSFANFRIRILFHCGKLDLFPLPTH